MKKKLLNTKLLVLILSMLISAYSFGQKETYSFSDSWNKEGMSLKNSKATGVTIGYSIQKFSLADRTIEKNVLKEIELSGNILPNEEGAPNLPSYSTYVAVPNGATAKLEIVNVRKEIIKNVDLAAALDIPFVGQEQPKYQEDLEIYSKNAFYPENPIQISEKSVIRGVEVVTLGITPFQYNPVTKELIVYRDLELNVDFEGGKSEFGENRLRSRYFEPILRNTIMNYTSLPKADYSVKTDSKATGCEYLIVVPDDADFIAWADTIKQFRTLQGIHTDVVTITEIGGNNVTTLKNYFVNAYNNWDTPPAAVLIMADYGTSGVGITSQEYSHPYQGTYITDNFYADVVNSDGLPDIAFARMTAQNAAQLEVMVTKFKNYELNPPTATNFYDNPITACGWQTERWFQICSEAVGGYLKNVKGKNPVRINEIYDGTPGSVWSTAPNTADVVSYFGPDGLGYIPASPLTLGNWSGGNATDVINAINGGAFMLQHRDHGASWGWGEPSFTTTDIGSLTNTDLSFIFSMNCSTGQFSDAAECFAEKFHRLTYNGENAGALGLIAATQVSYSFVNDALVWGMYDYMWPDFMPDQGTITNLNVTPETLLPGFASVNGKYFLSQSNWPYNTSDKAITYNLFHLHGDAFTVLYSEVPQNLTVNHAIELAEGATSYTVTADAGSFIALTVDGQILATAEGTGSALAITIPAQLNGSEMIVTITKQNCYRYSSTVPVNGDPQIPVPDFSGTPTTLNPGANVQFTDLSTYLPTSWIWTFEGGTPSSSTLQNPVVTYNTVGSYQVTLEAVNSLGSATEIKTGYINVTAPQTPVADFSASKTIVNMGEAVTFTDNSTNIPTSWAWTFNGGTPSSSTEQNPSVTFNTAGTYTVSLDASNAAGSDIETKVDYITVLIPDYCTSQGNNSTYEWIGNVQIGTYSNASGAANYTDFTSEIVTVASGLTNVTLTPTFSGTVYNEYWKIWVDLNVDGDFDDTDELVFDAGSLSSSAVSGNINIPAYANGVTSRMRVSMKYDGAQTACESFSYGEVEDYTITITGGDDEAPTAPSNLAATNITMTTVDLSWTASTDNVGVTGYDIYQNSTFLVNTANTSYNIAGLNSGTLYSYYVIARDAAGNQSPQSNTVNITTNTDTEAPTAPSNLASSNITNTTVDLNWDASSDNVGVTGYDVYKDGLFYVNTAGTSFNVTGLSESTAYSFYVKAKDAAGNESAASNSINVTTTNQTVSYCTSGGASSSLVWISNVEIGTYTNSSGAAGYTDFTSEVVSVSTGLTAINLTHGKVKNNYRGYWKIWVDLNIDGDFDDADELVFDAGAASRYAVSGNISIPVSANGVTTRMRVSMKYNVVPTACETFSEGEVEDYTVSIGSSEFSDAADVFDNVSIDSESKSFNVYPNPANKMVNVELVGYGKNINVKILDINGRTIQNLIMDSDHKTIDIEQLNAGIYLIVIEGENEIESKRFIKE